MVKVDLQLKSLSFNVIFLGCFRNFLPFLVKFIKHRNLQTLHMAYQPPNLISHHASPQGRFITFPK